MKVVDTIKSVSMFGLIGYGIYKTAGLVAVLFGNTTFLLAVVGVVGLYNFYRLTLRYVLRKNKKRKPNTDTCQF